MRRAPALVLLLTLLAPEASLARDRALLVGIGEYQVTEATLPGIDRDIAMMREVVQVLGFDDSQVRVLTHSQATLQAIRDAIGSWLVAGTSTSDRALVYFSGHGTRIPDASGDEADGRDEAFLPYDFREVAAGPGHTRLVNVLSDDELGLLLARVPAREVVVLVDSCHSGTITRSPGPLTSKFFSYAGLPPSSRRRGLSVSGPGRGSVVTLSAAQPEEDAQTSSRGALFTQGVWQAVRRARSHRRLTLEQLRHEAGEFIHREVGARRHLAHTPMLTGEEGLRSMNLFLVPPDPRTARQTTDRPLPGAGRQDGGDLWHRLEGLVKNADHVLTLTPGREVYRVGESLRVEVVAPRTGYLHVLNMGDGEEELVVLYPNPFQPNNRVEVGDRIELPPGDRFRLPARLPPGRSRQRNLLVAIHTTKPLAFYPRARATPEETFPVLRRSEFVGLIEESLLAESLYGAGQVVVTIEGRGHGPDRHR